jgi:hypothetical protein
MKKLYCFLLLLLFPFGGIAQQYGNEWIDYSQKYYKFSVTQTGLHRIDYNTLVAAGIPVSTIPTETFQIFGRENEVPLYLFDNNDNSFDPGDYFVFAAKRNDGWMDSVICLNHTTMANPAVSLINDTLHYFFSWTTGTPGQRFILNTDNDFAGEVPISFVIKNVTSEYNAEYCDGIVSDDAIASAYTSGEGYSNGAATAFTSDLTQNNGLNTPNHYNGLGAPFPIVHFRSSTASHAESSTVYNHHLRVKINSTQLLDSSWSGYKQMRVTKALPNTLLAANTNMEFTIVADVGAVLDRQALTYYTIRYPRTTNSNGAVMDEFFVPNNGSSTKSRIDLASFGSANAIGFYKQGVQWYAQFGSDNSGVQQFLIPNNGSGTGSDLGIYSLNHTISVSGLSPVNGNGIFTDFSSSIADSMLIMITSEALISAANNYKVYRESAAGGSFPTVLALFSELTDQFGGGVPLHPGAIRRFAHYFYNNTTIKPAGLFLVGKGINSFVHRFDPAASAENKVPCLGYPGSDNALTSGLEATIYEPLIPTGRISLSTNQELENYLAKVVQYEDNQNPNSSSFEENLTQQKQILHFVGGSSAQQQTLFQSYMNEMKGVAEDSLYAGNVTSYYKTTSDPLDPNVVAGVTEQIAAGVSIMNFFGHAAQSNNGFEINIDEPSNWNNTGKYPFVIGNSCHNGDIYASGNGSTSERFVNIQQEGAIGFISSVGLGFSNYLYYYSTELYRQLSNKNYGKSFAYQIQQAIKTLQYPNQNLLYETTYHQMALNGDPLLRINVQEEPEITIKQSDLSFSPSNITLAVDSIELTFTVRNIGVAIYDSVSVEIRRDFPGSNIDSVYNFFIPYLNYDTTITKSFPLQPEISGGINQFTVSVDIPSFHSEQFEEATNNTATSNFFIPISGINPIWPYNYAVVPYDTVTVKASTINPIADLNTYLFELDTTDTYDSPQLRRFSVTELGGVKEVPFNSWKNTGGASFPLVCTDSTVYFWRVAVDSSVLRWSEFSFQYIEGKRGWGQDHFFQFKNNDFSSIHYNRTNRLREFIPGQAHTMYVMAYDNESIDNQWGIDGPGNYFDYATIFGGEHPGIYVGVLDPITLTPWYTYYGTANPDHDFGNGNTQGGYYSHARPEAYFAFNQDSPTELAAFENMIENEIPDGHLVTIYSVPGAAYSNWTAMQPSLYNMFTDLGSTLVNSSQPEKPFAMIFRMGDPGSLIEKHYPDTTSSASFSPHVLVEFPFLESDYVGIEKTPLIGPSFEWQTLYWKRDSLDLTAVDSVRLKIERYDINQALQSTLDLAFSPNDSLLNLNSVVDANTYPYIRLNIYNQDGINFTPAQIDRLHVLYSPVPEAAIDGTAGYYISPNPDSLHEGQQVNFAVDIKNVSDYDMDSLLVNYRLEDVNHQMHTIPYVRQKALLSGEVFRDTITFTTLDFGGYNGFWMEVNPYINGSIYVTDQLEQYHFNNILNIPIQVDPDDEHPILDVTFNGRHILNNDIVDPESEIVISLKDDNPYLVMNSDMDTTLFGIYITDPAGNVSRIPFMDDQGNIVMQWYPANAQTKKFKIVYPAAFQQNGIYTLLVQGTDKSGNISGDYEYRVKFEIIRESSITYLMNYPNPFSTSTRFVFTLTGSEEPEDVLIQIMTVSGRVIREINEDQLGRVYIGRNISEYAWDGTDEFGDPLANGVYLYRVKAKINGEDIKHRESGADQYFKEEFGKMYLMR